MIKQEDEELEALKLARAINNSVLNKERIKAAAVPPPETADNSRVTQRFSHSCNDTFV